MKVIKHHRGFIQDTGYKPRQAYNATRKKLEMLGFVLQTNEAVTTKSLYIVANSKCDEFCIDVRFSDHTAPSVVMNRSEKPGSVELSLGILVADITCSERYQEFKEALNDYLKDYKNEF